LEELGPEEPDPEAAGDEEEDWETDEEEDMDQN
jgi:hypothetical protein